MRDASDLGVRRLRMVEEQLVRRGLRDEDVLAAMRSVPRHLFVPDRGRGRRLRRHAAAHRPRADDLAALHGRADDRAARGRRPLARARGRRRQRLPDGRARRGGGRGVRDRAARAARGARPRARSPASATPTCTWRSATAPGAGTSRRRSTASWWRPPRTRCRRSCSASWPTAAGSSCPSAAAAATRCSRSSSAHGDAFERAARHALPLRAARARRRARTSAAGRHARQRRRRGRGLAAARRRGRPRRQHVPGGGGRHEVRRRQGQRRRAGRVLPRQRAPRGQRCAACAAGCATRATARWPCACRASPPPSTPCSTGAAWVRRRRASRGSRSRDAPADETLHDFEVR